jgi:hypothetical protein
MIDRDKYEGFLLWLVTPQNDKEAKIFKEDGFVDDYISLTNSISKMADTQLLDEIDNQLKRYGKIINRSKVFTNRFYNENDWFEVTDERELYNDSEG